MLSAHRAQITFCLVFICLFAMLLANAQEVSFEPVDHAYMYKIGEDGQVKCVWSTTIIPKEPNILYTFSFVGGEAKNYRAEDSSGRQIDVDVNEENGQRAITMVLAGYQLDRPYRFNLSFDWKGLVTRIGDRSTLYTKVDVAEPQAASIIVIPPSGSKVGTSIVATGNSTVPFEKEVVSGRTALVWQTNNTGNGTEIVFRANFNYYNAQMALSDNLSQILSGLAVLVAAMLAVVYRKRLSPWLPKIKERI